MIGFVLCADSSVADESNTNEISASVARLRDNLEAVQRLYQEQPTNSVAAWQTGRACFEWSATLKDSKEKEKIITQGIAACRKSVALDPKSAAGHYYLAITLGKLADIKRNLAAYTMVKEVEREFHKARELDERFNNAGPDRSLGLLYHQAPGWPMSIGHQAKARKHLERAAILSPGYPENRLQLAEAYSDWQEKKPLTRELRALEKLWPVAKTNLTGVEWEESWADWEKRRDKLIQSPLAK